MPLDDKNSTKRKASDPSEPKIPVPGREVGCKRIPALLLSTDVSL
jgi:hypothetical protein